jgi:hypothetical protein
MRSVNENSICLALCRRTANIKGSEASDTTEFLLFCQALFKCSKARHFQPKMSEVIREGAVFLQNQPEA